MKDVNDNVPQFVFTERLVKDKYFGAIPLTSQIGSSVLQVKVRQSTINTELTSAEVLIGCY